MGHKRDWKQCNKQLVNGGKIHFWISPNALKSWKAKRRKKNGHPFVYSDEVIKLKLGDFKPDYKGQLELYLR